MKLTNNLYFYPEQGILDCNTYVVNGNPNIIIDPGNAILLPSLVDSLHKDNIDPKSIGIIANTHLHVDHCGANQAFQQLSGAKINLHPVQKEYYNLVVIEGAMFFGLPPVEFKEDALLENDRLIAGETELELIHSPGHSPDCVCFYYQEDKVLICGDVIFNGNTGRVDLPGGSADELIKSIERLSKMEIEYLLPGHMNIVTGADKVESNFNFIKENVLRWL